MTSARNRWSAEQSSRRAGQALLACALLAAAISAGCEPTLETTYGEFRSKVGKLSVNGTDVLGELFTAAGHTVTSRSALFTKEMQKVDTIVWFPDDYQLPSAEACEWFDGWLSDKPGRTLIYVGRHFDAAPLYWHKAGAMVPADKQAAYRAEENLSRLIEQLRKSQKGEKECEWFELESADRRDVRELSGPWQAGVDAQKAEIELSSLLKLKNEGQKLLETKDATLVTLYQEPQWGTSRLIAVTNGSFLLNLPLVNHEHRKLAAKLIETVGPAGHVVFLESGPGGPAIDPSTSGASMWTLFGAWPINVILLQLALLGIIFCFARWPIFGRPRQLAAEALSDFGKHVEAVGQLLRRTKNRRFAIDKVRELEESGGLKPR